MLIEHRGVHLKTLNQGPWVQVVKTSSWHVMLEEIPFSIECKNVERLNVWEAYEQCCANAGDHQPALFMKKNRKKPLVVVTPNGLFNTSGLTASGTIYNARVVGRGFWTNSRWFFGSICGNSNRPTALTRWGRWNWGCWSSCDRIRNYRRCNEPYECRAYVSRPLIHYAIGDWRNAKRRIVESLPDFHRGDAKLNGEVYTDFFDERW